MKLLVTFLVLINLSFAEAGNEGGGGGLCKNMVADTLNSVLDELDLKRISLPGPQSTNDFRNTFGSKQLIITPNPIQDCPEPGADLACSDVSSNTIVVYCDAENNRGWASPDVSDDVKQATILHEIYWWIPEINDQTMIVSNGIVRRLTRTSLPMREPLTSRFANGVYFNPETSCYLSVQHYIDNTNVEFIMFSDADATCAIDPNDDYYISDRALINTHYCSGLNCMNPDQDSIVQEVLKVNEETIQVRTPSGNSFVFSKHDHVNNGALSGGVFAPEGSDHQTGDNNATNLRTYKIENLNFPNRHRRQFEQACDSMFQNQINIQRSICEYEGWDSGEWSECTAGMGPISVEYNFRERSCTMTYQIWLVRWYV